MSRIRGETTLQVEHQDVVQRVRSGVREVEERARYV
jgi:hypothetical protein